MDYYAAMRVLEECSAIKHHGIKGQRWGIRRFQNSDGSLTESGKKRLAKLEEKAHKHDAEIKKLKGNNKPPTANPHGKKSVFDMSDKELQKEIDRLNLEKRYKDYMKELYPSTNPGRKQHLIDGRKVASDVLNTAVTNVGKSVATNALGFGVNRLGKGLGLEFDLYTTPNKKKKKNVDRDDDD